MTPASRLEGSALSAWIRAQRPRRPDAGGATNAGGAPDEPAAFRAVGAFLEIERAADGHQAPTATLLLRNRECPWQCLMCDLWQHMLEGPTPAGAIPAQIRRALFELGCPTGGAPAQVKLYNSGSFFDPRAIPPDEYGEICAHLGGARHVVVESHPRLIGARMHDFSARLRDTVGATLEVALGLETSHPGVLRRLNKRATLDDFARAAETMHTAGVALRCFVLVRPPFLDEAEALEWALRTTEKAFELGAGVVSLIATRAGNGAMEQLAARGEWAPPRLSTLERALDESLARAQGRCRVFADTWALEHTSTCAVCFEARRARLDTINRTQRVPPPVACAACGA